jgi:hypothetical protein
MKKFLKNIVKLKKISTIKDFRFGLHFLPTTAEHHNSAAYEKNFRLRDKNHAPFKLNGQARTAFGLLKAPELQRLSVTVEVLRVGVMIVGVLSVEVMPLSHMVKNEKMKVLTCQKSCFKHKWMISKN